MSDRWLDRIDIAKSRFKHTAAEVSPVTCAPYYIEWKARDFGKARIYKRLQLNIIEPIQSE